MVKIKYWVQFTDCTVIKVRYFETKAESERMVEELSDLLHRLINRKLILNFRIEEFYR